MWYAPPRAWLQTNSNLCSQNSPAADEVHPLAQFLWSLWLGELSF